MKYKTDWKKFKHIMNQTIKMEKNLVTNNDIYSNKHIQDVYIKASTKLLLKKYDITFPDDIKEI